MKLISKKQSVINRELKRVYKEIANERGHYCTGCGRNNLDVPLSHSHIIPRSRRPDLVTDKNNITYHCLDTNGRQGCHTMWEGIEREKLLDYTRNMEYILEKDTQYYFLINGR